MSTESPPARKAGARPAPSPPPPAPTPPIALRLLDGFLIAAFLALVFLLGVFPLKDTDFWWHLRTGDWIREHRTVPTHDLYTFTVPDHRWIDLHWLFQVALSWGYAHGGVPVLNLAKCAITSVAVLLLLTARRRGWPVWVTLLAWIPGLLVLGGRMYVRPETLTLLYLAADLAILFHWERYPALAWALPIVQLFWVNSQGLFVLGPIVVVFALVAAVSRPDAFSAGRRRWWRTVTVAVALTGAACLLNPYGIAGALYPLQLAGTMNNPLFTRSIAELTPIPEFIRRNMGWNNLPLLLQMATIVVGALSFLVPIAWAASVRIASGPAAPPDEPAPGSGKKRRKGKAAKAGAPVPLCEEDSFRHMLLFRFLLFAAFTYLSLQATRNSHQFAAVVGAVTSWNFAEWAAAVARRRGPHAPLSRGRVVVPRLATLGILAALFVAVASGRYYALAGEGRIVGLGEEPLWYPHAAARFAGAPGMPERFVSFHDGYAPLYEYYHGPGRKVFADARLEVVGAELYARYVDLRSRLSKGDPAALRELDEMGRPAVLAGHVDSATVGITLMASSHWRCVWFDPVAAVFVHDAVVGAAATQDVDFAARHFRPEAAETPRGSPALLAMAKGLWNYASGLQDRNRADLARPMVLLGLDHAARLRQADPQAAAGWKVTGQLEAAREPAGAASPRYRLPFDPVFDLSAVRATCAFQRALRAAPDDFMTLVMLERLYSQRAMDEERIAVLRRLTSLRPINPEQGLMQDAYAEALGRFAGRPAPDPPATWENLSELDRNVGALLASGRAAAAADLLERAYPDVARPWEVTDRIATLRLHLGEPERARALWEGAAAPPRPAIRQARVAVTYLAEGAIGQARHLYADALRVEPDLFEAHYGLAVLEEDAGHAPEAHAEALKAAKLAPNDVARAAAQVIVDHAAPFARR